MWLLVTLVVGLMLLAIWASLGARSSGVAIALLVVMAVLYRFGDREGARTANWLRGAASEQAVGQALAELRAHGFTVMHDIEQDGEGNIDHLVAGPTGVYLIETKHRRYEDDQLRKARRQAAKLHDELRVWITPVICLDRRASRAPYRHHGVWIVCRDRLVEWICGQKNPVVGFERLASFADRL
jgi:Nuclease-related domain